MKIFQEKNLLVQHINALKDQSDLQIGFVPTMGALHQGHLSLVQQSKEKSTITIASIFVNPTQFNDVEDFNKYPIQIDRDLEMLLSVGCDVVYVPSVDDIYPNGVSEQKPILDLGFLSTTLEAEKRPGHYEGVVQVVKILLEIVQPHFLFLGQKDYQQCMVIQKLIDVFGFSTQVVICETKREYDGLAMSSRNVRLNEKERRVAILLYQALENIKENYANENIEQLIQKNIEQLSKEPLIDLDYLVVVNGKTLENIVQYDDKTPMTALIAAKVGAVRLIDNLILR